MEGFLNFPRRLIQVFGRRFPYGNSSGRRPSKFPLLLKSNSSLGPHYQLQLKQCGCICTVSQSRNYSSNRKTAPKESKVEEVSSSNPNEKDPKDKSKPKKHEPLLDETEEGELALREVKLEKRRLSDLVVTKSPEDEEKERKRYEKDLPPKEEWRHRRWREMPERAVNKALIRTDFFENLKDKNKDSFAMTLEMFSERDVHLRGHVEFIYAALSQMKHFGIHRDLESYKRILDVFPKGKMISTNMFQVEFMHYPKQQQCAIDVLEQMEEFSVMPDTEMQQQIVNIFGSQSFPMRKASRMLYWMPKFKHLSPWRLPDPLPDDCLELAKLAIQRITSVDLATQITIYDAGSLEDSYDQTWIVSGQSPDQQKLIESHPSSQPIYVEGAFRVWLNRVCINYFVLRAEPRPLPKVATRKDFDDVSKLTSVFEENFVTKVPTVHEQEDGVILGICATGTSSRDSLISWIRFLEESNPRLGKDISVLFTLKSPIGPTDDLEVLSYDEAEKQKLLEDKTTFSIGSGGSLGFDPKLPSLKQVGVWTESESKFPNWPHHHHSPDSPSAKNLKENRKILDEQTEKGQMKIDKSKTRRISIKDTTEKDKRIE